MLSIIVFFVFILLLYKFVVASEKWVSEASTERLAHGRRVIEIFGLAVLVIVYFLIPVGSEQERDWENLIYVCPFLFLGIAWHVYKYLITKR